VGEGSGKDFLGRLLGREETPSSLLRVLLLLATFQSPHSVFLSRNGEDEEEELGFGSRSGSLDFLATRTFFFMAFLLFF
jgi:hypothetical protein